MASARLTSSEAERLGLAPAAALLVRPAGADAAASTDSGSGGSSKSLNIEFILTATIMSPPPPPPPSESGKEKTSSEYAHPRKAKVGTVLLLEVTALVEDEIISATGSEDARSEKGGGADNNDDEEVYAAKDDAKDDARDARFDVGNLEVLCSKALQWPSSILDETTTGALEEAADKKKKKHERTVRRERAGISSVSLCRHCRSSITNNDEVDEAESFEKISDALDTLQLLTLGIGGTSMSSYAATGCDNTGESASEINSDQVSTSRAEMTQIDMTEARGEGEEEAAADGEVEAGELLISILSNDGKLYLYDVLELICITYHDNSKCGELRTGSDKEVAKNKEEDDLAALFLGKELLSKVHAFVAPLSQPKHTVVISQVRGSTSEGVLSNEDYIDKKETIVPYRSSISEREKIGFTGRLMNFDSTVEPTTAHLVTTHNKAMLCAAAFSYIIVAGEGMCASGESGGFLSFVSLDYFSVTKTLFLPFCPKAISPVVWSNKRYVIVHGEGKLARSKTGSASSPSRNSPELIAICLDSCHNEPDCKTNSHTSMPSSLRRFVPIPIEVVVPDSLSSDSLSSSESNMLSVVSLASSPPSFVTSRVSRDGKIILLHLNTLSVVEAGGIVGHGPVFRTQICKGHFAVLPLHSSVGDPVLWCVGGQGWSLVGVEEKNLPSACRSYFITWEGRIAHSGQALFKLSSKKPLLNAMASVVSFGDAKKKKRERKVDNLLSRIVATIKVDGRDSCFLSLRKLAVLNKPTTPCNDILSWLCQTSDYHTAAMIVLSFIGDKEAVRELHAGAFPGAEDTDIEASYDGLLDGITAPVRAGSEATSLADIAVLCMIRGRVSMSRALDGFLSRNNCYDASRACSMLTTEASRTISECEAAHFDALSIDTVLWPIQALLRIAVARDCMPVALESLNNAIPNQMKCMNKNETKLNLSIISIILASSPSAAPTLLSLSNENGLTYWQSLSHDARLALSTIITNKRECSLLREPEVRAWTLEVISSNLDVLPDGPDTTTESLPADWIRGLCDAIFLNAGIVGLEQSVLLHDITTSSSVNRHTASASMAIFHDKSSCINPVRKRVTELLRALPDESERLDFNLVISALILSDKQNDFCWMQDVLVAICDIAGRRRFGEPDFLFDGQVAMEQCARAGCILASAFLVGGLDGFVLRCAYVLFQSLQVTMKQAEMLLMSGEILRDGNVRDLPSTSVSHGASPFIPTNSHRELLALLEEYVLTTYTHGQFYFGYRRGVVDPSFAARLSLRAWYILSCHSTCGLAANSWLETWLKESLGLGSSRKSEVEESGGPVRRRLACSALANALFWAPTKDGDLLAVSLGFSTDFFVELTQTCCGLAESIPDHVLLGIDSEYDCDWI